MKPGASDDPLAEDETPDEEPATDAPTGEAATVIEEEPSPTPSDSAGDHEPPYVLRRTTVKEDRENVTQFFLRDEIAAGERDLRNAVEAELDTDVMKLDLREAAYAVAQRHPEEIAAILREWGYEYR